ncbi:MAG: hypothetical protein HY365_01560 [Candidatus Aenigmarchaeota archaeon]|nr:hypothetical protein [Candidatus Aenigmarchaeota archaeon]
MKTRVIEMSLGENKQRLSDFGRYAADFAGMAAYRARHSMASLVYGAVVTPLLLQGYSPPQVIPTQKIETVHAAQSGCGLPQIPQLFRWCVDDRSTPDVEIISNPRAEPGSPLKVKVSGQSRYGVADIGLFDSVGLQLRAFPCGGIKKCDAAFDGMIAPSTPFSDYTYKAVVRDSKGGVNTVSFTGQTASQKYKMATLLVASPDHPATQRDVDTLKKGMEFFEKTWNKETPGIEMDAADFYQVEAVTETNPFYYIDPLKKFYNDHPDKKNIYDSFNVVSTWSDPDFYPLALHWNMPSRADGGSISYVHCGTPCKLRGLTKIRDMKRLAESFAVPLTEENYSDVMAHTIGNIMMHETGHVWGIYVGDTSDPFELTVNGHYRATLDTHWDPLGGGAYAQDADGSYSLDISGLSAGIPSMWHDFTLFQMGLKKREDVRSIRKMTGCANNRCSGYVDLSVDQVFPKNSATAEPLTLFHGGDADLDGIMNWAEREGTLGYKTDHLNFDTDGDGFGDIEEIKKGASPLDFDSRPLSDGKTPVILPTLSPP